MCPFQTSPSFLAGVDTNEHEPRSSGGHAKAHAAEPLIDQQWYDPAHPNINPDSMQHALHAPPSSLPTPHRTRTVQPRTESIISSFIDHLYFWVCFSIFIFLWVISHRVNSIDFFLISRCKTGAVFFEGQIRGGIPYGVKEEKMSVLHTKRCRTGLGGNRYRS